MYYVYGYFGCRQSRYCCPLYSLFTLQDKYIAVVMNYELTISFCSCKVSSNKKWKKMNSLQLLPTVNWFSFWYVIYCLLHLESFPHSPFSKTCIHISFFSCDIRFTNQIANFQASALITFPIMGAWVFLSSQFSQLENSFP